MNGTGRGFLRELLQPRSDRPRDIEVDRAPQAAPGDWTRSVLSAQVFESFLERERSLADRGTRRFTLLVVRLRRGGGAPRGRARRDALGDLARRLRARLRATDLVGRPSADRVEVLLTDTEPAGAAPVAEWVEREGPALGLRLEQTLYVYPSVEEPPVPPASHENGHDGHGSNGHGTSGHGTPSEHGTNGHAAPARARATDDAERTGAQGTGGASRSGDGRQPAAASRWETADLWPRLCIPISPWKRCLDILVSALALLVLLPVLALVALAIRLDTPGPAIFRQRRAGKGGRAFTFYKFRSMLADAEERRPLLAHRNEQCGPIFKIREDPRVTRVGRFLRRTSIDELPQLWNVLKGDLSLVGPRSPTFDEVARYERWQRRRLCITGGITCIWQVSGRSQVPFLEWMRLDMRYMAARRPWLDLLLLLRTVPAVLSGRGAC